MTNAALSPQAANLRAILAMLAAMACFTAGDVLVKLTSQSLPIGEMMVVRNGIASLLILSFGWLSGQLTLPPAWPRRLIGLRLAGEVFSTLTFLVALVALPIADALAIAQFGPLAVTAGAAIVLGEPVGWRRWLAALVGLTGVMLIIRPGTGAFSWAGVMALCSLAFIVLRDLSTRRIAVAVPTLTLTAMSAVAVGLSGLLMLPFEDWAAPAPADVARLSIAGVFLLGGYICIVNAMRTGEVATVSPFRYSGMLWALLAGHLIWDQVPDGLSLLGILIVCGAGLYAFHRERLVRSRAPAI